MKVGVTSRDLVTDFRTENEMDDLFGEEYKDEYGVEIPDQLMFDYLAAKIQLGLLTKQVSDIFIQKRGYL